MASTLRNRVKNFSNKSKSNKKHRKLRQKPGNVGPIKCSVTGREAHGPKDMPVRGKRSATGSGRMAPTGAIWQ